MKKLSVLFAAALALSASLSFAQFSGGMTTAQVEQAVKQQLAQGKSPADVAKSALAAGVNAGTLTTAMLLAGANPSATVTAIIAAGGDTTAVVMAAVAAGVPPEQVASAARAAGANPAVVQAAIDRVRAGTTAGAFGGVTGTAGGGAVSAR